MKVFKLFTLAILLLISRPLIGQSSAQYDFSGKWISTQGKDTLSILFVDDDKIIIDLGNHYIIEGNYKPSMNPVNNDLILKVKPQQKMAKDSLVILMAIVSPEEYRLKAIMHYYKNKPPESELLDNRIYILRKQPGY